MKPLMQRYFIRFAYDGADYHGFQIQPHAKTIQEEIEKAIALLTGCPAHITGAGRTDAGVNARNMVAHVDFVQPVDAVCLAYKLNKILPQSIAIHCIEPVDNSMHARFSAKQRTYNYYIHTRKDPLARHFSAFISYPLDFDKMNVAAELLLETDDFAAFCKSNSDVKTTLCKVTRAEWIRTSGHTWYFTITANRFLRNMVRAVTGTLVDVGRGKLSVDDFRKVIEGRNRSNAGDSMPAHALCLENILYEDVQTERQED